MEKFNPYSDSAYRFIESHQNADLYHPSQYSADYNLNYNQNSYYPSMPSWEQRAPQHSGNIEASNAGNISSYAAAVSSPSAVHHYVPISGPPPQFQQDFAFVDRKAVSLFSERPTEENWRPFEKGQRYDLSQGLITKPRSNCFVSMLFSILLLGYIAGGGYIIYKNKPYFRTPTANNGFLPNRDFLGRQCGVDAAVETFPYLYFPSKNSSLSPLRFENTIPVCTALCPIGFAHERSRLCPEDSMMYCTWFSTVRTVYDFHKHVCLPVQEEDDETSSFLDIFAKPSDWKKFALSAKSFYGLLLSPIGVAIVVTLVVSVATFLEGFTVNGGFFLCVVCKIVLDIVVFTLSFVRNEFIFVFIIVSLVLLFRLLRRFFLRPMGWNAAAVKQILKVTDSFKEKYPRFNFAVFCLTNVLSAVFLSFMTAVIYVLNFPLSTPGYVVLSLAFVFMTFWILLTMYHGAAMAAAYGAGTFYFESKYADTHIFEGLSSTSFTNGFLSQFSTAVWGSFVNMFVCIPRLAIQCWHGCFCPFRQYRYFSGKAPLPRHLVAFLFNPVPFIMATFLGMPYADSERIAHALSQRTKLSLYVMHTSLGFAILRFVAVLVSFIFLSLTLVFVMADGFLNVLLLIYFGIYFYTLITIFLLPKEIYHYTFWLCYVIDQELDAQFASDTASIALQKLHTFKPIQNSS